MTTGGSVRRSNQHFPLLFSPVKLGTREAPNRIVSTSHSTSFAAAGKPTDQLIAYHAEKAKGGCGVVMMFGGAAASPLAGAVGNRVALWMDEAEPALRQAASEVKSAGALALSQLALLGRYSLPHSDLIGNSPSPVSSQLTPSLPHVLSTSEIHRVVDDCAASARRLRACGFDGCDLTFYADSLPDEFWDRSVNHRTDSYGGSLPNRMRLSLDITEAVRGAVGPDFIVGARVSVEDQVRDGLHFEELLEIIKVLDASRRLDYFTVTGGTIQTFRARGYNIPSAYFPLGTFVPLAARVKASIKAAVIVTGRIITPGQAEEVIRNGSADLVGMTRALIADPELPRKAAEGREGDIRVCLGSNEGCIDRLYFGMPIACVQNPVVGHERSWATLTPAARPKRVVVVGGGPAGMEAARILAQRGHKVRLLERASQLGGSVRLASKAPGWEGYEGVVVWLQKQLEKVGVEIELSHEATLESVGRFEPEAVIVATGAQPRRPYLPGAHLAHTATVADVASGAVTPHGRCVILDETGYTPGPKLADALSERGLEVQIVTSQYSLGEDIGTTLRVVLMERLLRKGVTITPLTKPVGVDSAGVNLVHMLTDAEWHTPAETVIFSSGGVSRDDLYWALLAARPELRVDLIGDALAPRHLRHAMADGARVGREIE